VIWGILH